MNKLQMRKINSNNLIIISCISFSLMAHALLFSHNHLYSGAGQTAAERLPARLLVKFGVYSSQNHQIEELTQSEKVMHEDSQIKAPPQAISQTVSEGNQKNKENSQAHAQLQSMPTYKKKVTPKYPQRARQLGQQGRVEVMVMLDDSGEVINALVHKSSGFVLLDAAALNAVKLSIFNTEGGKSITVAFDFKLD